MEALIELIPDS